MASVTGICNRALQRLGAARIADIADNTNKSARACNAAYEAVRDALLRKHPWSFAIKRAQLAADTSAPVYGYANAFPWPADALRILKDKDKPHLDWQFEGRRIVTNQSAPLEIRYIAQITDPNSMDVLFREALSCELADAICEEITGSAKKKQIVMQDSRELVNEAKATNAIERVSDPIPDDTWVTSRA